MDEEIYEIETVYGPMMGFRGDLISKYLEHFGEWAPFETMIANTFLEPGQTIVDAGAFLGTFAMSVIPASPSSVVCVEANVETIPVLKKNVDGLGGGVISVQYGALGINQSGSIITHSNTNRGGAIFEKTDAHINESSPPSLTLFDIRSNFGDYHLVKLDVEGCELAALKGDQAYLHKEKPTLMIEANETSETCQVANYCRWLGYELVYVSLPTWRRCNPNKVTDPLFALAHEAMLIAYKPSVTLCGFENLKKEGGFLRPISNSYDVIEALWATPRWSTTAWMEMDKEQLIAILGHCDVESSRHKFQVNLFPSKPFG